MNCYLIISKTRKTCEGCKSIVRAGVVAMCGSGRSLDVPQCPECLAKADRLLAAAWVSMDGFGGMKRLKALSPERRREIAQKAAARWGKRDGVD